MVSKFRRSWPPGNLQTALCRDEFKKEKHMSVLVLAGGGRRQRLPGSGEGAVIKASEDSTKKRPAGEPCQNGRLCCA